VSGQDQIRQKAFDELQRAGVLMLDGHFDYGNGYHGRVYLNPHQLFRFPSTIWRFAQDLIDLMPAAMIDQADVVAGPATGGALLAHTIAGLLDSRRKLTEPARLFAPFAPDHAGGHTLRPFYGSQMAGKRVLLADDVRNTGQTFERCAALVTQSGGTVIGRSTTRRPRARSAARGGPSARSRDRGRRGSGASPGSPRSPDSVTRLGSPASPDSATRLGSPGSSPASRFGPRRWGGFHDRRPPSEACARPALSRV
jgi:orotate phosphoribosyltransferase